MTPASSPSVAATIALASVGQRQLWMHDRLYSHDGSYNISLGVRLVGPLDVTALRAALNAVVARHEPLRTTLSLEGEELCQIIAETLILDLPVVAVDQGLSDGLAEITRRLQVDGAQAFDLDQGPLLRAVLYRLGPADHALTLVVHHAVFDGWSVGLLLEELGRFYEGACTGRAAAMRPLDIQYADFAEWQHEQLAGAAGASNLAYWQRQLAGAPLRLDLPTDRPPRPVTSRKGALISEAVSPELRRALAAACRAEHATLFMVLMAGFAALLHRYTRQQDILIGTPVAGRNREELEPLIGFFINMVLIRSRLEGDPTFRTLLDRIKATTLDAQTHQHTPFDQIDGLVQRGLSGERAPLLQAVLALQSATPSPTDFGRLQVSLFWGHNGTAKYDLFLNVVEEAAGLRLELEYDQDLFDGTTATRFLDSYRVLLTAALATPDERVSHLSLLSGSDRAIIDRANSTTKAYPRDTSIAELFQERVRLTPDAVALTCGDTHLTYDQLNRQANRLARRLMAHGVGPDVLVGVALDRSPELVVTILGILKAGGAYVPLDLGYPNDRLAFMLSDTQVPLVVTTRRGAGLLPTGAPVLCLDDPAPPVIADADDDVVTCAGAEHLAYVMYTSGSTGQPKGVAVPNRGIVRLVRGTDYVDWDDVESVLHMAPIAFDASTFEIWGALLNGKRVVIVPDRQVGFEQLGRVLRTERVDCLWLTAALFNEVIDERPDILAGVSQLLIGGEALSVSHVRRALNHLPSTRIINGYGPTESTTFACCHPIPRGLPPHLTSVPIGLPIANTQAHVLDPVGVEVPVGVAGELHLGGDGLARGYLNQPSLSAERFIPDPFSQSPSSRLYRTGDLVRRLADGTLVFLGRLDRQVKLRGFRIELGEIESVLDQHPAVQQAAAILREDIPGHQRIVAYVRTWPLATVTDEALRAHAQSRLPEYMVPSSFVLVEQFALTPNGKMDHAALPAPADENQASAEAPVETQTPTEAQLAEIWRDVLGAGRIGLHDSFFHLGGHSLMAVRLFSRIRTTMGVELPLGLLLQYPTVAALAAAIDRQKAPGAAVDSASSITPLRTTGSRPPIFFTHGVGGEVWSFTALTRHLGEDQPVYGLQPSKQQQDLALTVPQIAARYVDEIRAVSPHGPYMLAGHCAGAAVAYEMARQLVAAGERVALLVVIDYWFFDTSDHRLSVRVVEFARNLPRWIREDLAQVSPTTVWGRIRSKIRLAGAKVKGLVVTSAPVEADIRDRLGMWRFPDYQVSALQQAYKAFQDYHPEPYEGDVLLIRARTLPLFPSRHASDLGWSRLVRGTLTVEAVRGSHETILQEPLVAGVAKVIREAVDHVIASQTPAAQMQDPRDAAKPAKVVTG